MNDNIAKFREEIAKIDKEISKLLEKREKFVIEIGKEKKKNSTKISNLALEQQKLKNLKNDYQKNIFKKIFSESRKLQSLL